MQQPLCARPLQGTLHARCLRPARAVSAALGWAWGAGELGAVRLTPCQAPGRPVLNPAGALLLRMYARRQDNSCWGVGWRSVRAHRGRLWWRAAVRPFAPVGMPLQGAAQGHKCRTNANFIKHSTQRNILRRRLCGLEACAPLAQHYQSRPQQRAPPLKHSTQPAGAVGHYGGHGRGRCQVHRRIFRS